MEFLLRNMKFIDDERVCRIKPGDDWDFDEDPDDSGDSDDDSDEESF